MGCCVFLAISRTSAETIECKWVNQGGWKLSPFPYYCHQINFYITQKDEIVTSIKTPHNTGKSGQDVDGLYIGHGTYHYLPANIEEFFPDLKAFWVSNTGLKEIKPCHLSAYKNLREFHVDNCLIEVVESDLFINNPKLEYVSFQSNKIKYVAENVLKPLMPIIQIYFNDNHCINQQSNSEVEFTALQKTLLVQCPPKIKSSSNGACRLSNVCEKIAEHEAEARRLKSLYGSECSQYDDNFHNNQDHENWISLTTPNYIQ